jgi:hypothetical protein
MRNVNQSLRRLRITSDNMYDPGNPHDSFLVGDIVSVNPDLTPKDGDVVIVASGSFEAMMKLTVRSEVRHFTYIAPDQAGLDLTGDDVSIVGVVTELFRPYWVGLDGPLKWLGDDIGLNNDHPICVNLADQNGRSRLVSLREALTAAERIDDYGLERIMVALHFAEEHGYLRPMDLDAWNVFKADRSIELPAEVCHA